MADGIVYDNIRKNGIPYDKWLKDFDARDGVSVEKIWDFISWINWMK